jgi:hypothetical protein
MGSCPSPTLWISVPHFSGCYKPSPLQAHWEMWCHTRLLWPACLFIVCVWSAPLPSRVGVATPAFSGWLVYLQFAWGRSAPPPHSRAQGTPPSLLCVFFFMCLFIIHYFFLGGGQCVHGAMLICPRKYHVLLTCSPGGIPSRKQDRIWCLVAWKTSCFLCLMWQGDAMHGLVVWRCPSFAPWWFFLPGVSPASLQEFTLGSMLSASSL